MAGNVDDAHIGIERWDDARAVLRLLAIVFMTDRTHIGGAIIMQVAVKFAVVTLVMAVHFAGDMRGVQFAIQYVGVLSFPFGVVAGEPWLSDRSAGCWCRRVCAHLALFISMEEHGCRFN